jgi:hypothetical protein
LFQTGNTSLNRQETKFAKDIDKIAKITWRHRENLGVLSDLAVRKSATA